MQQQLAATLVTFSKQMLATIPNATKRVYGTNGWFHGLLADCSKRGKYRNNWLAKNKALKSEAVVGKGDLIK